jgi:hypothetical protein
MTVRRRVSAALVPFLLCLGPPLLAQDKGEGSTSMFLSYTCPPQNRAAFRAYLEGPGGAQLEKWKKAGTLEDYFILFTTYVNADVKWDALVRLDFDRFVDTEKWKAIERTMPGGLSAEGLALCSPLSADTADLTWEKAGPSRDLGKAVYLVLTREWVEKNRYLMYVTTKVKPEFDAWLDEGALSWYGVYINQNPSGPPWDALILLEYKDLAGLASRDVVKRRVRKEKFVGKNPAWSFAMQGAADATKEQRQIVIADPLLPR